MPSPDVPRTDSANAYFGRIASLATKCEFTDRQGRSAEFDIGISQAVQEMLRVRSEVRKVLLVGNGGSASIAGHIEMDLCNRLRIRACTFNDPPLLTSLANDHGFGCIFERSISLWADVDDCLIAVSSSGKSENILRAVQAARHRKTRVMTFSGFRPDNPLRQLGDWNFYVLSSDYGEVEVVHHMLGHCLTDLSALASR